MKKLTIAVVGSLCNPNSGARTSIDLSVALAKLGHKIFLYTYTDKEDPETVNRLEKLGIVIRRVKNAPYPPLGSIIESLRLYRLLTEDRPTIILGHTTVSLTAACRLTRLPVIGTYYGSQFDAVNEHIATFPLFSLVMNSITNLFIFFKMIPIVYLPNEVVSISKFCSRELLTLYRKKSTVIYQGNSPDYFINHVHPHLKKKKVILLSISRITPYKQFDKLIFLLRKMRLKNVELIIVGSAPKLRYLNYLQSIKTENTKILVDISEKILADLYNEADIYITADKYLFFGLPIMEAAVFQKPTISFNYGAAAELIVSGKTGFVADSWIQFKNYLSYLIDHPLARRKMGTAAGRRATSFSWSRTARGYEKLCYEILKDDSL